MPTSRPRPAVLPLLLATAVALALLSGCQTVDGRLAVHAHDIETAYREEASLQADLPVTPLGWEQALQKLRADNLSLRESRAAVISAEERRRQVYKDLLPGVNITADLAHALTDLGDLSSDDATLSLIAFLNIPGIIQFRMNAYAASLELVRARWACELRERELTIQLREQFLRAGLLEQRRRNLRVSFAWDDRKPLSEGLETSPESLEREALLWSLRDEQDTLQDSLSTLLGDNTRRWKPLPGGLPGFDYATTTPDLADTGRYGQLFRQLQAVELEGARLTELGARLQYWPDIRVNLTSPPLYSSSNGRSSGFDADQVLLTLSTSVPIDIRGNIARQLRDIRRRNAILRERMAESRAETLRRLSTARENLERNQRRLRLTALRLDTLRRLPLTPAPGKLRENLERLLTLDEQQADLLLEQARLESLFWLFDETRWQRPDWSADARSPTKS